MDWINIKNSQPKVGSKVWAQSAFGDTYLGTVKKSKHGYSLKIDDTGQTLHNFQKWSTFEVIY